VRRKPSVPHHDPAAGLHERCVRLDAARRDVVYADRKFAASDGQFTIAFDRPVEADANDDPHPWKAIKHALIEPLELSIVRGLVRGFAERR
jgi:hypothetical protein